MFSKIMLSFILFVGGSIGTYFIGQEFQAHNTQLATKQMSDPNATRQLGESQALQGNLVGVGWLLILGVVFMIFWGDIKKVFTYIPAR